MQKEFEDMVFEFAKRVSRIKAVQSVILFGSVARGEADKRSDVDVLVVFGSVRASNKIKEKSEVSKIALDVGKEFDRGLQLVLTNKNFEKLDRSFVEGVLKEGVTIYGRIPRVDSNKLKLEPYSLIYFSLGKLARTDKMKLRRILYGHETEKKYKGKVYKSRLVGLVEQVEGRRTGIASVLIPVKKAKTVTDALKRFGAEYSRIDVWISSV